jgi:subtilisin family serine protease
MSVSGWKRTGGLKALSSFVVLVALLGLPSVGKESGGDVAAAAVQQEEPPSGAGDGPTGVLPPDERWTVTLLTGEVVDVRSDADGRVTAQVHEHEGGFQTVRDPDGALYVIPLAATPLLVEVLDRELFNVTGLIQQGYDDESRDSIGLIVQREPGADLPGILGASDDEQPLPSIDAVAVEVPKETAGAAGDELLRADSEDGTDPLAGVTKVWLDRQVTVTSSTSLPTAPGETAQAERTEPEDPAELDANLTQVGADEAWEAGLTGEGVSVAVLDTGIDSDHPDLAGEVVAEENFSASDTVDDRFGHGTHVAAIAAGTGTTAEGARQGVAPDAKLLNGKVLDDNGFGFESDVIGALEWGAAQADVVNISAGALVLDAENDPFAQAVDRLSEEHDTLFVVAAGNSGPISTSVDTPGIADRALTVGAVDVEDALAEFSSRGPVPGSFALKPEVVAPGVDIVAARAADTELGDPVDADYTTLSGTSMATPHVAGAAAILAGQHPDWGAEELKTALIGSTDAVEGAGYGVGAGRLDIGAGIEAQLLADRDVVQSSLDHPRTAPHEETLTWTNRSAEPQTIALEAELHNRDGDPADAVSVDPAAVTIAPGETGSATLSIDGPDLADGLYSGTVTAVATTTAGSEDDRAVVRTPVAVHAVPEQAELTIAATPPVEVPGATLSGLAAIVNLDDFAEFNQFWSFQGDGMTVTVPVGRYSVIGAVNTGDFDTNIVAQVGDPDLMINEDTTVAFDGSAAEPLHPTVEGVDTAPPMYSSAALISTPTRGTGGIGLLLENYAWYPMPAIRLTPMDADPEVFAASQTFRLQAQHLAARIGDETIEVVEASFQIRRPQFAAGEHTVTAVDAGDGSDLSGARDRLAVVQLPPDEAERTAVIERAVEAGVAVLAFVDEQRSHLTLSRLEVGLDLPTYVPMIAAGGSSASRLLAAGEAGEEVTVTSAASPYVYDIVGAETNRVAVDPVIDQAEQERLATLDERFHRDPDEVGPSGDRRYPTSVSLMNLDSEGPLLRERTAYVSPDVQWDSIVFGPGHLTDFDGSPAPIESIALSMNVGERYGAGEQRTLTWLRRPQWPGPVGGPLGLSGCQPLPVARDAETLFVWLAPFQDSLDRFGCSVPLDATLTLERDGSLVDSVDTYFAAFEIPEEPGDYTLTYEQEGESPYAHRSHTTWTFDSAGPDEGEELIPLVVVDY